MLNLDEILKHIKNNKILKKTAHQKIGKKISENKKLTDFMIECVDYVFENNVREKTKKAIAVFMHKKKRCEVFKNIIKEFEKNGIEKRHLPYLLWKYHKRKEYYFNMNDFMICRWILSSRCFELLNKGR